MKNVKTEGIITKAVGGNYYVAVADGVLCCNARGVFRKEKISPCAGDNVVVSIEENAVPLIVEIKERKNHIIRPPLANLDCALLVTSAVDPVPNTLVTDKLISIFESKHIEPVIVITKQDLRECEDFAGIYRKCGFKVFYMDNSTGNGIDEIRSYISGKLSALIGNSGVGKSSLMNHLFPGLERSTGDISKKLGRGRHTTRFMSLLTAASQVMVQQAACSAAGETRQGELFAIDGGYIADTPGFSTVEVSRYGFIPKNELQYSFREFSEYLGKCRFRDCVHLKESGCAVTEALREGKINSSRYDSYVKMCEEAERLNEWEFKNK